MDRKFTLSFRALGMSKINENGSWEVDMQNKNPDITKLSNQHYILTSDMNEQGNLVQQVFQINFPSGSSDVKQDKDAFGKSLFTYSLSPSHQWFDKLILILGVLILARGLYLVYRQNKPSKPVAPMAQTGSV